MPAPTVQRPRAGGPSGAGGASGPSTTVHVGGHRVLRLAAAPGRVAVGLVLPGIDRTVDVTVHPAAARTAVVDAARRAGLPHVQAEQAVRAELDRVAEGAGAWQAPPTASLLAALGGASYPVLGAAYGAGADALPEVPRWAAPVLSQSSARAAARAAFGSAATRPVVGAVARSITAGAPTGAPVQLHPLARGLMGGGALPPDRLVRVLDAPGPLRGPDDLPDRALIQAGERVLAAWGPVRGERVLVDAAALDEGPRLLAEAIRFARDLGAHGPRRLPNRLAELHAVLRARIATDAHPRPPRRPARQEAQQRHPAAAGGTDPALLPPASPRPAVPVDPLGGIHHPPAVPRPERAVHAATPLVHPPALAALDGRTVGELRVVLPRTCGDLTRWGSLLSTCVGSFGPAVATGRSSVVGIERDGRLRYALELRPGGLVRQFTGHANRVPHRADRAAVIGLLAEAGAIDVANPANRPWLGA